LKKFLKPKDIVEVQAKKEELIAQKQNDSKHEIKQDKTSGAIKLVFDEEAKTIQSDKKILVAKKSSLEAQILSKVISSFDIKVDIVNSTSQLDSAVKNDEYDMLLIDKDIEAFNQHIISKKHLELSVIMLSEKPLSNGHVNTKLISDTLIGVITKESVEKILKKYRS